MKADELSHKVKAEGEIFHDQDFSGNDSEKASSKAGFLRSILGPVNTNSDASVASQIAPI